jgi:hypothetical protein
MIYFHFFDTYIKLFEKGKEVIFNELYINNSSYRRCREKEQGVGPEIISKLAKYYNLRELNIYEIDSYEIYLNDLYSKIYYKDNKNYENDFEKSALFLCGINETGNEQAVTVYIKNGDFMLENKVISNSTVSASIEKVSEKGFTYAKVYKDHIIFWKDETGYYGLMWVSPAGSLGTEEIQSLHNIKLRPLLGNWYEVGTALNSI